MAAAGFREAFDATQPALLESLDPKASAHLLVKVGLHLRAAAANARKIYGTHKFVLLLM